MHIKDQILSILVETGSTSSLIVGQKIGVHQDRIVAEFVEIQEFKSYWIQRMKGYGDAAYLYATSSMEEIKVFLEQGGFTKVHQSNEAELEQKLEQQKREVLLSELQIKDLLRLPEEAKGTRQLSWIAIGVSTATLLFEVVKAIFS